MKNLITKQNKLVILAAVAALLVGLSAYNMSLVTDVPENASTLGDPEIARILSQSSSDEIEAIEKDLAETNINAIDQEVLGIQTEIEAENPQ